MTVSTLRLDLRVGDSPSPRERRRRLQTIMSKLRQHFNVSVAEDGRIDDPAQVSIVVAVVGKNRRETREILEHVVEAVDAYPRAELVNHVITEV